MQTQRKTLFFNFIFYIQLDYRDVISGGGGPAPPELPKFLLIMAVYCIEMYYLPLYTKAKKLLYLLETTYRYMVQNSAALTRTLRLL